LLPLKWQLRKLHGSSLLSPERIRKFRATQADQSPGFQNKNCRPNSDDYHYFHCNLEILDRKYKLKAWIRQNPATVLLYVEVHFEAAEHVEPGELSPLAQEAQQAAFDFLSNLGVSVKPLPIERLSPQKKSDDPNVHAEPDYTPF
jgi:hypothetical protein